MFGTTKLSEIKEKLRFAFSKEGRAAAATRKPSKEAIKLNKELDDLVKCLREGLSAEGKRKLRKSGREQFDLGRFLSQGDRDLKTEKKRQPRKARAKAKA